MMKLNLQREALLKPLQHAVSVVERKQALPILANVLIDAKDNIVSITGTDLEVELIGRTMSDHSLKTARFTLPARKLMDICKALPENACVELYQEKEKVVLKSGRARFALATLPAEDFPAIETQDEILRFNLPQKDLKALLQRTTFAMAQQDVRYYLNGMLLEISRNSLRAVATDGHRLALNTLSAQIDPPQCHRVIIPRKGVLGLMRLLEDDQMDVSIKISNNHIRVEGDTYIFTSKLIDGQFPDYEKVIPKIGDKVILLDRDELRSALARTAILCNEKFRGVRYEIRKNLLKILVNNLEQEAAEDELSIDYNAGNLDIAFNVNYLLDILSVFNPGLVRLSFIDANSSMLVEEVHSDSESVFVVMPMRL